MLSELRFSANSSDEVNARLLESYGGHSRIPVKKGAYRYVYRSLGSDRVAIGTVSTGVDEVVRACVPSSRILIHLSLNHANHYRVGRKALTGMVDKAVVLPPDHDYTLRSMSGHNLGLAIDAALVTHALEGCSPGRQGFTLIRPHVIRLEERERRHLFSFHRRLQTLTNARADDGSSALRTLESELAFWCANAILKNSGRQTLSPRNQMRVERIIDWIDRHLMEPISVDQLADVCGLGAGGAQQNLQGCARHGADGGRSESPPGGCAGSAQQSDGTYARIQGRA